jgi:hypothetical protein
MDISEESIFVKPKITHLRDDHKYEFVIKFGIEGGEEVRSRTCTLDTQLIAEYVESDVTKPNSDAGSELEALGNLQGNQVKIKVNDAESIADSDSSTSTFNFD